MMAASAIVSQSAAAAAVLRVAEGALNDTPRWYPAAATAAAATSVLLPMAALLAAWMWSGATFVVVARRMPIDGVAAFRKGALTRNVNIGAAGSWIPMGQRPVVAPSTLRAMLRAAAEALYGEYRGGGYSTLAVAQFIAASQALQGVALAAGELTARGVTGGDGGARASCEAAAWAQLAVMATYTTVLVVMRPYRVRRQYYAELLPTAVQAGVCGAVVILAARRARINATVAAWVSVALDVTSTMQPVLALCLAAFDALA
jgi:hypothetical protein